MLEYCASQDNFSWFFNDFSCNQVLVKWISFPIGLQIRLEYWFQEYLKDPNVNSIIQEKDVYDKDEND